MIAPRFQQETVLYDVHNIQQICFLPLCFGEFVYEDLQWYLMSKDLTGCTLMKIKLSMELHKKIAK